MNKLNILKISFAKAVLPACLALATFYSVNSPGVTLYRWVDEEGNVSYQDKPPPRGQKFEEKSFSREGARTGDTNADVARSRAIRENPVTLYLADNCESCTSVGIILDSNNVPYEKIRVDTDADAQKKLIKLVGSIRVPTLIIGENVVNGFKRSNVEDALKKNGYPDVQTGAQ